MDKFEPRRDIDRLKTRAITDLGCKIIRIHYTWIDKSPYNPYI